MSCSVKKSLAFSWVLLMLNLLRFECVAAAQLVNGGFSLSKCSVYSRHIDIDSQGWQ